MARQVSFTPRTLHDNRARYEACLETLYTKEEVVMGLLSNPYCLPRHVFDFQDGLRLFVSRQEGLAIDHKGKTVKGPVVHVASSVQKGTIIYRLLVRLASAFSVEVATKKFLVIASNRFVELSGDSRTMRFIGFDSLKAPHWVISIKRSSQKTMESQT